MNAVFAFVVSLVVSGIAAPIVMALLQRLNSRQKISEHVQEHAHKQGTPTMGGIIILIGLLAGSLAGWVKGSSPAPLLLVLLFGAIGFFDDFVVPRVLTHTRGLGWKQKLVLQVGGTVAILFLHSGDWLTTAWMTFFVLAYSNAYNFSDGLDALAGSLAMILATSLALLAGMAGAPGANIVLMVALIGGLIPFLFYNSPPARVFMGDVGALPIGALLGFVVCEIPLRAAGLGPILWLWPMALLSFVMIAELVPVPIQIASVKLRGKRVFPRTPIHHAFQAGGWPETKVVAMFGIVQLLCAIGACLWVGILVGKIR